MILHIFMSKREFKRSFRENRFLQICVRKLGSSGRTQFFWILISFLFSLTTSPGRINGQWRKLLNGGEFGAIQCRPANPPCVARPSENVPLM